ncbi:MAG: hypothetical protein ACWA5R_10310 [bacterium]
MADKPYIGKDQFIKDIKNKAEADSPELMACLNSRADAHDKAQKSVSDIIKQLETEMSADQREIAIKKLKGAQTEFYKASATYGLRYNN